MLGCAEWNQGALQTGALNGGVWKKWEGASPVVPHQPSVPGRAAACPSAWLGVTVQDFGDPPVLAGAGPGVRNFSLVLGRICLASASRCAMLFCFFRAVKKLLAIRTGSTLLVSHRKLGVLAPQVCSCRCECRYVISMGFGFL